MRTTHIRMVIIEVFRDDRLALAALFTSTDYIHAMQRRRELVAELNKAMLNILMNSPCFVWQMLMKKQACGIKNTLVCLHPKANLAKY